MFEIGDRPTLTPAELLLLEVACYAAEAVSDVAMSEADRIVQQAGVDLPTAGEMDRICKRFHYAVPAEKCRTLADIINAGWKAWEDDHFWDHLPFPKVDKNRAIKELILKNIETLEFEALVGVGHAS
jgi:hypothetical protein